jgi:hypothetical protein
MPKLLEESQIRYKQDALKAQNKSAQVHDVEESIRHNIYKHFIGTKSKHAKGKKRTMLIS